MSKAVKKGHCLIEIVAPVRWPTMTYIEIGRPTVRREKPGKRNSINISYICIAQHATLLQPTPKRKEKNLMLTYTQTNMKDRDLYVHSRRGTPPICVSFESYRSRTRQTRCTHQHMRKLQGSAQHVPYFSPSCFFFFFNSCVLATTLGNVLTKWR